MKELKRLPLSVQTFKNMREGNYVYVDKTEHIHRLTAHTHIGMYFLSRPRRFGKSLTVSTLKELFEGNRTLFKGLWIEDKWDWSVTNPVIHISFSDLGYKELGLEVAIKNELKNIGDKWGITFSNDSLQQQFKELVEQLGKQRGKVVILIDEYDKPIIDFLEKEDMPQAKANQKTLKNFYSILKGSEDFIRLLFITGVSKFSQVSIFSDLNHLTDLTMHPDYATLVGYTQEELESNFEGHIEAVMNYQNTTRDKLLAQIKEWYDGFSWDGIHHLYNPFGTLTFLNTKVFSNVWFTTATPTFLVNLIKERGIFRFEEQWLPQLSLEKYDLSNLDLIPLLFQTGYLTVKQRDITNGDVLLDYPNREVRDGMYQVLMDDLTRNSYKQSSATTVKDLSKAFLANDLDKVKLIINVMFTDLPAPLYEPKQRDDKRKEIELSERFFHGVIHLMFKYLGIFIDSEVYSSFGRADSVVTTATHIYVFEFKYNRSGTAAFEQIKKKKYGDKYRATGKTIIGIGVNFSHLTRKINGWILKEL
jgi:Predicted AAA-ATPase/PD-(D/E)XK nuclease superfamily